MVSSFIQVIRFSVSEKEEKEKKKKSVQNTVLDLTVALKWFTINPDNSIPDRVADTQLMSSN